jgi:hypothetical protein
VGEENGIITSACLTEGGTPLLQHVKITHIQWSVLDNVEAKTVDAKKKMHKNHQNAKLSSLLQNFQSFLI